MSAAADLKALEVARAVRQLGPQTFELLRAAVTVEAARRQAPPVDESLDLPAFLRREPGPRRSER